MNLIRRLFLFGLLLMSSAASYGADALYVFAATDVQYPAIYITNAGKTNATGAVVYGGIGNTPSSTWAGKIVLLDRGVITFSQKISGAKNMGALAVVIANSVSGPFTASLGLDTSTLTAVTISMEDGLLLRARVGETVTVGTARPTVTVTPTPTPTPTPAPTTPVIVTGTRVLLGVLANSTVSFIATADGTQPITFQWKREGVVISGATNSTLTIFGSTLLAGNYTVVATNVAGFAESNPYNLQVAQP